MAKNSNLRPYIKRLAVIFLICLVFVLAFNEVTYALTKDEGARAPEAVQVIIPEGTAARLAAGEIVSSIPAGLTFVAGDVLEVINLDQVDHQLGPLWIPAGTTASLALDLPERLSYDCSFSSSRYLDIEVKQPTTLGNRITALALGVPTLTALIYLYSLAALPLDREKKKKAEHG